MIIIDVREPHEYQVSHVNGAINLPLSSLERTSDQVLADLDKDTKIVLYCRSGQRSAMALNILRQKGYTNLVNGIHQANVEANH